jgi:hypothetical protein
MVFSQAKYVSGLTKAAYELIGPLPKDSKVSPVQYLNQSDQA